MKTMKILGAVLTLFLLTAFFISSGAAAPVAGSTVYVYEYGATGDTVPTTYYRYENGLVTGSVTTDATGTFTGDGITEGIYDIVPTGPTAGAFILKYPAVTLGAYKAGTGTSIDETIIIESQPIDFIVTGTNGLPYGLRFTTPAGGTTNAFGKDSVTGTQLTFADSTIFPESQLRGINISDVQHGEWKVKVSLKTGYAQGMMIPITPSKYLSSNTISFTVSLPPADSISVSKARITPGSSLLLTLTGMPSSHVYININEPGFHILDGQSGVLEWYNDETGYLYNFTVMLSSSGTRTLQLDTNSSSKNATYSFTATFLETAVTKKTQVVVATVPTTSTTVYVYEYGASGDSVPTTYYLFEQGVMVESITTDATGTFIGDDIKQGLYGDAENIDFVNVFLTLKYPSITLDAYKSGTNTSINGATVLASEPLDFSVSGTTDLLYGITFTTPAGGQTTVFGHDSLTGLPLNFVNSSATDFKLLGVDISSVTPGEWSANSKFIVGSTPGRLAIYTPAKYLSSNTISFTVSLPPADSISVSKDRIAPGSSLLLTLTGMPSSHVYINIDEPGFNILEGQSGILDQYYDETGYIYNFTVMLSSSGTRTLQLDTNSSSKNTTYSFTATFPSSTQTAVVVVSSASSVDEVPLQSGWNFISIPKTLNTTIQSAKNLFVEVDTDNRSVLGYDAFQKVWVSVQPDDLIHPLNAYWIYAKTPCSVDLAYPDTPALPAAKTLYPGWNAVGLSSLNNTPAQTALFGTSWRVLIPWNLEGGMFDQAIVNGGSDANSPSRLMTPGNGYWVYVDSESTLIGLTA